VPRRTLPWRRMPIEDGFNGPDPAVISGIVLAASPGTRFGGTKQIVPHRGKPLVQHAVDALSSAGVDELVVVTGHDAREVERVIQLPPQGRFVRDPDHRSGQASSLGVGLDALQGSSEAAVVLLADQPGVTDAEVRALVDAFWRTRARIVRISYTDGPGPALLSREVYGQTMHLHGDVGAREMIASHPDWVHEVEVPFASPSDVDRPDDLDQV
jgi:molybdenum cofactor cytidylyltransferase